MRGRTWPRIAHGHEHAASVRFPNADQQLPHAVADAAHHLHRVDELVEEDLLQLDPIDLNVRQSVREMHPHRGTVGLVRIHRSVLGDWPSAEEIPIGAARR